MLRPARSSALLALVPADGWDPARGEGDDEAIEKDLIARARTGDRRAGEALYLRHVRYVGGMVVRLMRGADGAEDVVQDTFVIALNGLEGLRDDARFRAWIAQIAVSQIHRRYRRQRLRRMLGLEAAADGSASFLQTMAAPDAPPDVRAELGLLDRALARLGAPERLAWMLRFVEGEALEDVARLSDCSLATAKRRIAAAAAVVSDVFGTAGRETP
jgi:RNA polymerase sigma-70 factor (ECF subfamily)